MSFDYAVGDFFRLGQAAFALYEACSNASDVFQETAQQCLSIYIAIGQTQKEFRSSNSKLDRGHYQTHIELSALTTSCRSTLARLERIVGRYKSLATPAPRLWDTVRFSVRLLKNDDLADIRSKLTIHLLSLNVFLARVQGEALNVIGRKLDIMTGTLSPTLLDPSAMNDVKTVITHPQFSGTSTHSLEAPQSRLHGSSPAVEPQNVDRFLGASLQKTIKAKKKKLEALLEATEDMHKQLSLLTAAEQAKLLLPPQEYHYSKKDEWLCQLPDGWQRIKLNEQEYQYRYLFYGKDGIRTRGYDVAKPFDMSIDVEPQILPEGWVESTTSKKGSHYVHAKSGITQFDKPTIPVSDFSNDHFIGWKTRDGLPIDIEDIISLELARAIQSRDTIPGDDIEISLPQKWRWHLGKEGRPVYTYSGAEVPPSQQYESTVHPAHFSLGVTSAKDDTSSRLPIGWDRRLDTWGCVFYVDHNTSYAQRTHPQDDPSIDFATGLPLGWEETNDHNGVRYFFESSTLRGTYHGRVMRSETMDEKFVLQSRPTRGDFPPIEGGGIWSQKYSLQRDEADGLRILVKQLDEFQMPPTVMLEMSGRQGRGCSSDETTRRRSSV